MNPFSLFLLFAKIGFFTFGGGYAMVPLFQDELVTSRGLLTPAEFADLIALAQITPGPIGLNAATYIGVQQAGIPGAIAGSLGLTIPSLTVGLAIAICLKVFRDSRAMAAVLAGIKPVTVGLLASAVVFFVQASCFAPETGKLLYQGVLIMGIVLALCLCPRTKKINPAWWLLAGAVAGIILPG
jgi:chromate transporter